MANKIFENIRAESPELYVQIIDLLSIPVFCREPGGKIIACNETFANITGNSKSTIIGKRIIDIVPPEMADVLQFKDADIMNNGNNQFYENNILCANEQKHDVIINKAAMYDSEGKITGIVCWIIDISERKKVQKQLIKAEQDKEISSKMLQKIRSGIVLVDENLKILDSNLGFARMFGEENEELFETIPGLYGANLEMLVPEIISEMFRSIIESGESLLERDIRYQNKLLSVNVMTITRNKIAGAIIRDMSAPMLERAEIIERAREVNRKNLKTVQEIAYLLGENAAQTEELLHSIIEAQKYDIEINQKE